MSNKTSTSEESTTLSSTTPHQSLYPPLCNTGAPSVAGRTFIITGGTQGLGLAVAKQLTAWGAAGLVLVSRSVDKAATVCQELSSQACHVIHVPTDLSDAAAVESVVPRALQQLPKGAIISGLVNCAATTKRGNLFTTTAEDFNAQFALNVRAPFLLSAAVAKHVMDHNIMSASIVHITSCAAHGGAPFVMVYSATKAALVNLTRTTAAQLAPHGIRVNAVNMGWCATEVEDALQTAQSDQQWLQRADASVPLGRILRPTDVATTVAFLLSDASNMTTGTIMDLHPEFAHGLLSLQATDER